MKRRQIKRWMAAALALVITVPSVSGLSAPLTAKAASSAGVKYRYNGNGTSVKDRVGIRSVQIDDTTYYDIHDGDTKNRTDPNDQLEFLKAVLQSGNGQEGGNGSLIGQWSSLAEQIYGTHSKVAARVNADGGFSKNFAEEKNQNRAGYADLSYALAQPEEKSIGDRGKDYTKWSGLSYATNLKDVRQRAADGIAEAINHKIKGSDVLSQTESAENTLKQLDDDTKQDVLFSLVTCVDRSGSTFKYNYNTFGIAFYDFQLSVLAGDGLEYITKAQNYDSLKEAADNNVSGVSYKTSGKNNPVLSYYKNESTEEADVGMEFTQSHSLTTSNTLETGKSYSFSEMIGSETKLSGKIPLLGEVEETLKMEITCEQALSTAYSETKEYSESTENKVSANMTLPAQTAIGMESSNATTNVKIGYDCPVAVTFKVAIFSLSGVVYDDNAATQHFHTSGYRQGHFSTIFGSDSEKGGTTAMKNLYNRAVKYTATANYEESYGQTVGWSEKRNDGRPVDKVNGLNWKDILNGTINEDDIGTEKVTVHVKRILVDSNGVIQNTIASADLGTLYPVDFESVVPAQATYNQYKLYAGEVKDSSGNVVDNTLNYDDNAGEYSKWIQPIGQADKDALKADGKTDEEIEAINTVTFYYSEDNSGASTQNAAQNAKVTVQSAGTDLKDKVAWLSMHCPMSVTGGVLSYDANSMNSNINEIVPLYPLKNVAVSNGVKSLQMISGDQFDLANITLNGTNKNDVDYYGFDPEKGHWILVDETGQEVTDSDAATITENKMTGETLLEAGDKEGVVYLKYVIDEHTYNSLESSTYATNASLDKTAKVKVTITNRPFDGTVYAEGSGTAYVGETVNLTGHETIKGYALDASDKKISGAPIQWESKLDEEDGIHIENNQLSFTKAGKYQIRATYRGKHSDWITVEALPEKTLSALTISDNTKPATLESFIYKDKGTNEEIDLSKLTVKATDQYDGAWMDLSKLQWIVNGNVITGDKLSITGAGIYEIQAKCGDVISNILQLEVKEKRKLKSLEITTDLEKEGIGIGAAYAKNLSTYVKVKALDQYGDDFDWTKENYTWQTGGKYTAVSGNILQGLVKGSDTLKLVSGDGEEKIESNEVKFNVVSKPYVRELYAGDSKVVREGDTYDLTKTVFHAKDQHGEAYEMSPEEIASIEWELTDKGTIKSSNISFDAQAKTLSVPEGTLEYGETGNVILQGTFTNVNGEKAKAVQFDLNVRQQPILDAIELEKKDKDQVLKNGENAYVEDYFLVKGLDQYQEEYPLDKNSLEWNSENEKAFRFEEQQRVLAAVEAGEKGSITVSAYNSKDQKIISNSLSLQVPGVRRLSKIELKDVPKKMFYQSTLDLNTLEAVCYDEIGQRFAEDELKAYPAKIAFSMDAGDTGSKLDTAKNLLRAGDKKGYIIISAMAVNSSTTNEIEDADGNKVITSVKILVGPEAESVKLDKKNLVIQPKKSVSLKATVTPSDSIDDLTWKSSKPSIATVDASGKVKALAPGKTVITVTTSSGKKAVCNVTVGLRKGDIITKGSYRYQVTNPKVDGSGKMQVIGFAKGKDKKNVSLAKSVSWNAIKYQVTSIGKRAFEANKKIQTIVIPASIEKIGYKAFYKCPNVKTLTVGKNVTAIGAHAFCLNEKMTKIVFKGTKLKTLEKPHVFIEVKHAKVYVSKSRYTSYKKLLSVYGLGACEFIKR